MDALIATMSERLANILKILLISPQDLLKITLPKLDKRLRISYPSHLSGEDVVFTLVCWLREKILCFPIESILDNWFPSFLTLFRQRQISFDAALDALCVCMTVDAKCPDDVRERYQVIKRRLEECRKTIPCDTGGQNAISFENPLLLLQSRAVSVPSGQTSAQPGKSASQPGKSFMHSADSSPQSGKSLIQAERSLSTPREPLPDSSRLSSSSSGTGVDHGQQASLYITRREHPEPSVAKPCHEADNKSCLETDRGKLPHVVDKSKPPVADWGKPQLKTNKNRPPPGYVCWRCGTKGWSLALETP